jgi:hypothetical protein
MKHLIAKILKESSTEKIINLLNKKFTTKDFIDVRPYLEDLGYSLDEIKEILPLWFESDGLEFNVKNVLNMLINLDDLYLDWGYYNCGMGTCCDPDYIAISKGHEDEVFKLVNDNYIRRYYTVGRYFNHKRGEEPEELPEICMNAPEDYVSQYKTLHIEDEDLFDTLSYVFDDINDNWDIELRNILNNKFGANINEFRTLF